MVCDELSLGRESMADWIEVKCARGSFLLLLTIMVPLGQEVRLVWQDRRDVPAGNCVGVECERWRKGSKAQR